jgi:hypothetical protein
MYGSISMYFPDDHYCVEQKETVNVMDQKKRSKKKSGMILEDVKINVRIMLAALWISQFLLWTFGDMVALLQDLNEPVANELLAFVAAPLALIQAGMILFNLVGKPTFVRWANICVAPVFILFNIGYLAEAEFGWEFVLGIGYLLVNFLIIFYAWRWPKALNEKVEGI